MRPDDGAVPSLETFAAWPNKAARKLLPVLAAVAEAPDRLRFLVPVGRVSGTGCACIGYRG